jgi:pimeloyl-ACP methyl ester carboxylesterase
VIDRGNGIPLVLVPGIQGRYEWMQPAIEALADDTRVLSFSLAGEPAAGPFVTALGWENYLAQIDAVLDRAGLESAALCGVSFGGLIALRYAASRPGRVSALVLVSTPGPDWDPGVEAPAYLRHPWLMFPHFSCGAVARTTRELKGTFPTWGERLAAAARYAWLVAAAPTSPGRMARRASLAGGSTTRKDCARVGCPTLLVTGEASLDRVVPPAGTLVYTGLIRRATAATLAGTGHLGLVTRPERFAALVREFVVAHSGTRVERRGAPVRASS